MKELTKAVRISSVQYNRIKRLAIIEGREIKYFIDRAVENYLKIKLGKHFIPKENL